MTIDLHKEHEIDMSCSKGYNSIIYISIFAGMLNEDLLVYIISRHRDRGKEAILCNALT